MVVLTSKNKRSVWGNRAGTRSRGSTLYLKEVPAGLLSASRFRPL